MSGDSIVVASPPIPFRRRPDYPSDLETVTIDDRRHYITPAGNVYPSITTILSETKSDGDAAALESWRSRVGNAEADRVVANSTRRGTQLHAIAENYMIGNQSFFDNEGHGVGADAVKMWSAIKPLVDAHVTELWGTEVPMYSDRLQIAGRVDCIASCHGVATIVDFKNSRKPKRKEWIGDYFIQIAAYAAMHYDMTGVLIPEGRIWIAVEGSATAQEFRFRTAAFLEQLKIRRDLFRNKTGR